MAKVIKKNKNLILMFLIIVFGAFLRFYRLAEVPPSLFGDEVDVGYQAWSILKTGKDYSGNPWPIHFQSLADWRTPLFLYATVPFVWLFGLTELGVRFVPALFGVATIPAMYLLVSEFPRMKIARMSANTLGLVAALLLAISSWHLQYSRAAFEVTLMLFLLILGVWGFLRGLRSKNAWCLVLGAWCLALAPYSYNTAKLFVPLLVGLLIFCFWERVKRVKKGQMGIAILVFVLVCLPVAHDILLGEGGSRFAILSIFTDPTVVPQIGFERLSDAKMKLEEVPLGFQPSLSSRFFHNKFLSWGIAFLVNYFRAFSTEFLFTFGDINFRHSIQGGFGELFWLDALFLVFGVFWVFREIGERREIRGKREKLFLLGWLFLAPIPSALTRDGGNHATRLILMLPPLLIFVSLGILGVLGNLGNRDDRGDKRNKGKKILAGSLIVIGYSLLLVLYLHRYYVHWPWESERWWHPGFKEAGKYVLEHQEEYDQIVWSDFGEPPLIFFLFWTRFSPRQFQEASFEKVSLSEEFVVRRLSGTRFYFGKLPERYAKNYDYQGALGVKALYIMPEGEIHTNLKKTPLPKGLELLKIIDLPSSEPGMYIVSGKNEKI